MLFSCNYNLVSNSNILTISQKKYLRQSSLEKLSKEKFDLIIIGGGITGAGIALDAASRGLKVILFEKNDFASGTSSKSTKLIHGGLRYLKNLEINLVNEVGRERNTLLKNAPHLVYPEKMLLPIIKGGSLGYYSTALALTVYDFVASVAITDRKKMLNRSETQNLEPLLDTTKVMQGAIYSEYRTLDARLTISVHRTAEKYGSSVFNYTLVTDFLFDDKQKITGVKVNDILNETCFEFYADHVVNASGPWLDDLRKLDPSTNFTNKKLILSKGVHIVFPWKKFPIQQSVYFDTSDQRMIFAIKKNEFVYVGTTDTIYTNQKENVSCDGEDIEYLLNQILHLFPKIKLKKDDIISTWAGLRPLIYEEESNPSEISRKDEIFTSAAGLLSIGGGKLTGYRIMAKKVLDTLYPNTNCKTQKIKLDGAQKIESLNALISILHKYSNHFPEKELETMMYKYGENSIEIIADAIEQNSSILEAELRYCIQKEYVYFLNDFIQRRTSIYHFEKEKIEAANILFSKYN